MFHEAPPLVRLVTLAQNVLSLFLLIPSKLLLMLHSPAETAPVILSRSMLEASAKASHEMWEWALRWVPRRCSSFPMLVPFQQSVGETLQACDVGPGYLLPLPHSSSLSGVRTPCYQFLPDECVVMDKVPHRLRNQIEKMSPQPSPENACKNLCSPQEGLNHSQLKQYLDSS